MEHKSELLEGLVFRAAVALWILWTLPGLVDYLSYIPLMFEHRQD
jgi:hypothetical protein